MEGGHQISGWDARYQDLRAAPPVEPWHSKEKVIVAQELQGSGDGFAAAQGLWGAQGHEDGEEAMPRQAGTWEGSSVVPPNVT